MSTTLRASRPFRGGQQLAAGLLHATFLPLDGNVHLPDAADLDRIEESILDHVSGHHAAVAPLR